MLCGYAVRCKSVMWMYRSLTTSPHFLASKKEHRQRKQSYKRKEDTEWELQNRMNPFVRNVGMARQLKGLEVDVDDPTFKTEEIVDSLGDMEATLEERRDRSKAFRAKYKADEEHQKKVAIQKIIQKKVFPKPPSPNLLTWMEKEMIRYLHKKDPVEWSKERLSESFPATPGVIHKVLRGKTMTNVDHIKIYEKEVVNNWKLLSRGKLELDPNYEEHLQTGNKDLSLSSGEKTLAEQEIILNLESSLALPKPAIPGEFASIITDYNRKIAKDKNSRTNHHQGTQVFEMESLFGDNTIPGTPVQNEISVYGDTALLASSIDLKREKQMDVEKFRKVYLRNREKKNKPDVKNLNPFREKYLEWIKSEEDKSKYASKSVNKIESSEVSTIYKESMFDYKEVSSKDEKIDLKVSEAGETFIFDPDAGYKHPYINPENPDTIEIPKEIKHKYEFYQLGDSFYDREGEFLYRVPGLS